MIPQVICAAQTKSSQPEARGSQLCKIKLPSHPTTAVHILSTTLPLTEPQMQAGGMEFPPRSLTLHPMQYLRYLIPACLLFGLVACSKPQSFDYRDVKNLKIESVGFDQTALSMDLVYYNPNGFGVDLRKVDCDVYVDNTYLGKFQLDTLMHIQRRSEFTLPSRIMVDMKTVLKNSLNFLFSQEVLLNVKGTTRVGKAGIFATIPFSYESRHKLSF